MFVVLPLALLALLLGGFRLLSAYGLSSRSHTIRYKQTEPSQMPNLQ